MNFILIYYIIPTFLLSCERVLQGVALPKVSVCDTKQEWHFSDNTQLTHTRAPTHTHTFFCFLAHASSLSAFLPPLCCAVPKHVSSLNQHRQKVKQCMKLILTNMADTLKVTKSCGGSDRCQLEHGHAWSFGQSWPSCGHYSRKKHLLL